MTQKMEPVKHLLVDLDGTILGNRQLALSLDFIRRATRQLRPYGSVSKALRVLIAIQKEFQSPSTDETNDVRVVDLFAQRMGMTIDEARKVLRDGVSLIFPGLQKHFFPIPGSKDFLDWAKDHFTLTLATNPVWTPEIIELRVRWAGIDPAIFTSMTHIRSMHACKPAREYYEEILAQQGFKAEDCLLIGNEEKMDLPATRVGIRTYIVGPFKRVTSLKLPGAKAPGWKGPYFELRKMLEDAAASGERAS